jgi:mannose-6-phosphate isomerase-like protein (cupin superfamily)
MPDDQGPTREQRARLDPAAPDQFVSLRRQLGVGSFGMNQIALAPGQRGRIHRHDRQEEVYLVLEGTLTLAIEGEESDLGEGELIRVAPEVRRQLINRGPGRLVLLALGGHGEHRGRDGEAFVSWDDATGAPPQEIPRPADLDPAELRASGPTSAWPLAASATPGAIASSATPRAPAPSAASATPGATAPSATSALPAATAASPPAAEDAVARYLVASAANDVEALLATLAPDGELVSPLSGQMVFRGESDLRILATAVYGGLRGLRWGQQIGEGRVRTVIGEARVGPGVRLTDAMVFELDEQGRIARVRPHIRPWLGLTVFALALGPQMARHPEVILRALRAGSR